jgi:lipopolysaccharide/colanic/teichoic acid biosynthesis glycosyltransferase
MTGLLDRVMAAVALVVLSPVLLGIAAIVRIGSPGPVIYRQVRVGRGGAPFRILKFRTMVDGADRLAANVSPADDPRVTPAGRALRSWYLDELPQLVNVVRGDMRLVGPRPETPEYVAMYTSEERRVLLVKPGLVGPSTLAFMDEAARLAATDDPAGHYEAVLLHERVRLDLAYLDRRSAAGDVQLLFRQALAILAPRTRGRAGSLAAGKTTGPVRVRPKGIT